jgi:hypothetical protein
LSNPKFRVFLRKVRKSHFGVWILTTFRSCLLGVFVNILSEEVWGREKGWGFRLTQNLGFCLEK